MSKLNFVIYMHKNKINGKVYIGQTMTNPETRWKKGKGYKDNESFYNDIKKYGWEKGFEHILLETNIKSAEEADEKEKYYIKKYNSFLNGYNKTKGGQKYKGISLETHLKLSESKKGAKNPMYKHIYTDEERQKLSESHKKKYENIEERKKTSEAMKKYYSTPGAKEKQRQTIIENIGKKVKCLETGQIFDTVRAAGQWCGLKNECGISRCCRGYLKSAGKHPETKQKLHWIYIK